MPAVKAVGRPVRLGYGPCVSTRAPGRGRPAAAGAHRGRRALTFELDESKLAPPPIRSGIVDRAAIVERLLGPGQGSVIAVVAPPGYGKTTVLAQWAAANAPRVAWLSVDDRDNDPTVLLTYLAVGSTRSSPTAR